MNLRKIATIAEFSKAFLSGINFLLLAATLGPLTYGEYVVLTSVAAIVGPIVTAGYAYWVQPITSKNGISAGASVCLPIIICVSLPLFGLILLAIMFLGYSITNTLVTVLISEMIIYPIWASLAFTLLPANRKISYLTISALVASAKLISTCITVWFFPGNLLAWGVLACALGVLGLVSCLVFLRGMNIRRGLKILYPWLRRGFDFSAVGTASAMTDNVDRLVIGQALGSHAVGVYGMAGRLSAYGALPVKAIALVSYPRFFSLAEAGDSQSIRTLMVFTIKRGGLIGLLMAVLVISGSYVAELTYLQSYEGLFVATIFMALCIPVKAIQYGAGDVLYALNNSRMRLLVTLIGAALSATGAFVGATNFGLIGSAAGLLVAQCLVAVILFFYTNRIIDDPKYY